MADRSQTFQTDVINLLDSFKVHFSETFTCHNIGGLTPEYIAILKDAEKRIFIFDAKRKPAHSISNDDKDKMKKYKEVVNKFSEEINIPKPEIYSYSATMVFVYDGDKTFSEDGFHFIPFKHLRSYLLELLYYPNKDKVITDIASIARQGYLSKSQMEILFSGLKPYTDKIYEVIDKIRKYCSNFVGFIEITDEKTNSYFPDVALALKHRTSNKYLFVVTLLSERDKKDQIIASLRYRIKSFFGEIDYDIMVVNTYRVLKDGEIVDSSEWVKETPKEYVLSYLHYCFRILSIEDFFTEPSQGYNDVSNESDDLKERTLTHKIAKDISITYINKDDSLIEIFIKLPINFEEFVSEDIQQICEKIKNKNNLILKTSIKSSPESYDHHYGRRCEIYPFRGRKDRHAVSFMGGQIIKPIMIELFQKVKDYITSQS